MSKEKELKNIFPIENSDYYQFYLLEREQINKLKDFLEKQSLESIDHNYVQWLWMMKYRNAWKDSLKTGSFKFGE